MNTETSFEGQTVWRDGDRIRRTDGSGYGDMVSDATIRGHMTLDDNDERSVAFAEAVLAIRKFERVSS